MIFKKWPFICVIGFGGLCQIPLLVNGGSGQGISWFFLGFAICAIIFIAADRTDTNRSET